MTQTSPQPLIKKNPKQIAAYFDKRRFVKILAGRRGGKTWVLDERLLKRIARAPRYAEAVYIGPTNSHAKELAWLPLQRRMTELGWSYKPVKHESVIRLSNDKLIYVIGAENIDRVRGHKLWHATLDEVAYFNTDMEEVMKALRPCLADHKGTADFGTTPDAKHSNAYNLYMKYMGKFNWGYHHWTTLDNPYIDPQEIEEAKQDLDAKAFKQEYEATWETYGSLAYYNFEENTHIKQQPPINYGVPLHLCFDFNVNPTSLLLSQFEQNKLRYKKEYSYADSSTERTIKNFCEDFKDKREQLALVIRGDSTGNSRKSNTGRADYEYIEEMLKTYGFRYSKQVRASNPPIIDRVKIVNGWLKPIEGDHRIEVDPVCKGLIKDFSGQKADGRIPSDEGNLGHKADAAGYDIYWEWAARNSKPQGTVML